MVDNTRNSWTPFATIWRQNWYYIRIYRCSYFLHISARKGHGCECCKWTTDASFCSWPERNENDFNKMKAMNGEHRAPSIYSTSIFIYIGHIRVYALFAFFAAVNAAKHGVQRQSNGQNENESNRIYMFELHIFRIHLMHQFCINSLTYWNFHFGFIFLPNSIDVDDKKCDMCMMCAVSVPGQSIKIAFLPYFFVNHFWNGFDECCYDEMCKKRRLYIWWLRSRSDKAETKRERVKQCDCWDKCYYPVSFLSLVIADWFYHFKATNMARILSSKGQRMNSKDRDRETCSEGAVLLGVYSVSPSDRCMMCVSQIKFSLLIHILCGHNKTA